MASTSYRMEVCELRKPPFKLSILYISWSERCVLGRANSEGPTPPTRTPSPSPKLWRRARRPVRGKIHLNVSFAAREYDRTYVHPRSFILSHVSDLCKEPVRILQTKWCSSVARSASRYLKVRHEFCAAQVTHSKRTDGGLKQGR